MMPGQYRAHALLWRMLRYHQRAAAQPSEIGLKTVYATGQLTWHSVHLIACTGIHDSVWQM